MKKKLSHNPDLNQRPLAYKANALTNWAIMAVILLNKTSLIIIIIIIINKSEKMIRYLNPKNPIFNWPDTWKYNDRNVKEMVIILD